MPGTRATRQVREKRPQREGRGTEHARGATFASLTHGLGTGMRVTPAAGTGPFAGANALALSTKYRQYDDQARAWIARALANPWVVQKMSGNTGTAPELVVVGRYLAMGYRMHQTLFFQEVALRGFRLTRPFVSDVAIRAPGGTLILLPIDGRFFHDRTLTQQLDAQKRNRALAFLGRVVPVPDTVCISATLLNGFLASKQVP